MNIVIRTDSSVSIGSGHVMRCLTLAEILREKGEEVSFICHGFPGCLSRFIENQGYKVYTLQGPAHSPDQFSEKQEGEFYNRIDCQSDLIGTRSILLELGKIIDWLIVDHYELDSRWETSLRPYVKKIMVIDDLADRPHDCDLLLDQNYHEYNEGRYEGLVTKNCLKLLGPQNALLRREFREARKRLVERDGRIRRILISFGGADSTNETEKALKGIQRVRSQDFAVDVVVGAINPKKEEIMRLCTTLPNTTYHCQVDNMAELMLEADLAIGAGGTTIWERCCMGLPAVIISVGKIQYEVSATLGRHGYHLFLGRANTINVDDISSALKEIVRNDSKIILLNMSRKCLSLVDGQGSIKIARRLQLEAS